MKSLLDNKRFKATMAMRRLQRISYRIEDKNEKLAGKKILLSARTGQ